MFQHCRTQNVKLKFYCVRVVVNTSRHVWVLKTGKRFKRMILYCFQNPSTQGPILCFRKTIVRVHYYRQRTA